MEPRMSSTCGDRAAPLAAVPRTATRWPRGTAAAHPLAPPEALADGVRQREQHSEHHLWKRQRGRDGRCAPCLASPHASRRGAASFGRGAWWAAAAARRASIVVKSQLKCAASGAHSRTQMQPNMRSASVLPRRISRNAPAASVISSTRARSQSAAAPAGAVKRACSGLSSTTSASVGAMRALVAASADALPPACRRRSDELSLPGTDRAARGVARRARGRTGREQPPHPQLALGPQDRGSKRGRTRCFASA